MSPEKQEYMDGYRKNNAEELRLKAKEYRRKNAEKIRLDAKEYRRKNAEKLAQKSKEYGAIRKLKRAATLKRRPRHTEGPAKTTIAPLPKPLQKFVLTSDKVAAYLQLGRCYQSIGLADKFDTDAGTMWAIMNSLEYRGVVKTVRGSGPYKLWEKCDIAPVILTTPISTKMPYFGDLDYV